MGIIPMTKKLAVVISGAVSLGSYEAGVAYEVLEAIAKHNEVADSKEKIEIDVITGASAGGITATILAKSLLCHGTTLRDPYRNPLYKAWVEEVKMLRDNPNDTKETPGLLEVKRDLHKTSLLNPETLDQIAKKVLPDEFRSESGMPIEEPHPTVGLNAQGEAQLMIGIAMANLNGFPLSLRLNQIKGLSSLDEFCYSQYKDHYVVRMARPNQSPLSDLAMEEWEEYADGKSSKWERRQEEGLTVSWQQLRDVALSSGAFPFAFGVRAIKRHSDQNREALYKSRDLNRKQDAFTEANDPFKGKYVYTDGGVFENEPIGLALSLLSSLYTEEESQKHERYFLFIAPGARKAAADPFTSSTNPPDHLSVAKALAAGIMGQSRYQDWISKSRNTKVLAVTSEDKKLLGDVFSAFAGFLEEKFRAYDYNVGRQTAQEKLKALQSSEDSPINKRIQYGELPWPPPNATHSKYWVKNANEARPRTPGSWREAQECFQDIAAIKIRKDGKRDPIAELNLLLDNVETSSREQIRIQILERVRSLVGFFYERSTPQPGQQTSPPLSGLSITVGFWMKGVWALFRGRRAMESFIAAQVDRWLHCNIHL